MKIISIYSELPNQGLADVMKIVYKTLHELNVDVEEINLRGRIPFYDGFKVKDVADIISKIQMAEACILATSVNLFAPTALMKAFLEHCNNKDYQSILINKCYMTISVSSTIGEREASEYLYRVISILGGSELGRIAIGGRDFNFINSDPNIQEAIERNIEDFYRLIRQNRRTFVSSEAYIYRNYYNDNAISNTGVLKPVYTQETPVFVPEHIHTQPQFQSQPSIQEQDLANKTKQDFDEIKTLLNNIRSKSGDLEKPKTPIEPQIILPKKEDKIEAYEAQFELFEERQEEDIKDIAKMFAQQMDDDISLPIKNTTYGRPVAKPVEVVYREKTCKQMMQSLPHHFQSHLATDVRVVFQFSINGEETFEGYLSIVNGETNFMDGVFEKADIYIYIDSNVMKDVLRGKYSAQKAFMTGQLKVRGNFVLLNKLDQLYKKMS